MSTTSRPILVFGATGYIGGRLVTELLKIGYQVRVIGRSLAKLQTRSWAQHPNVEIVQSDILDRESTIRAAKGCGSGYYLIPPLNPLSSEYSADFQASANMIEAADEAEWKQLIHLCAIWGTDVRLSPFLKSRREVKTILDSGKTPVTSLHVAVILGCGSVAFEIIHHLVNRFYTVPGLRWMKSACQPIATPDLIDYMIACLNNPDMLNRSFELGGPQESTYQQLMQIYKEEAGLPRRRFLCFPFFNSRLSAYWIHMTTPVPAGKVYQLVESLKQSAVCQNEAIRQLIPSKPMEIRQAFRLFINQTNTNGVETHWTDAGETPDLEWLKESNRHEAGKRLYKDHRQLTIRAPIHDVWRSVVRIGGETGWYYGNWLWKIRGFLDQLVGGVGLSRGRRHTEELRPGDALDVWRVHLVASPNQLTLVAEMKLPGKAVLDFQLQQVDPHSVQIRQTAWYQADGFSGMIYWFSVLPFHGFIFQGMIQGIAKATRLSHRLSYQAKLIIKTLKGNQPGQFVNISEGGCKIFSARKIPKRTNPCILLEESVESSSTVQVIDQYRVRDGYFLSLKFKDPNDAFRSWLQQTIHELTC
jgi:uncharacterized protein YbjT (DUF2867 family)